MRQPPPDRPPFQRTPHFRQYANTIIDKKILQAQKEIIKRTKSLEKELATNTLVAKALKITYREAEKLSAIEIEEGLRAAGLIPEKEKEPTMNETPTLENPPQVPFQCIQKCNYCNKVTHSCVNEACKEPPRAVCENELCQAKMLIDYYSKDAEKLREALKDKDEFIRKLRSEKDTEIHALVKKVDHYRLILMQPEAIQTLIANGTIDTTKVKIYLGYNRSMYEKMPDDVLLEFKEIHHEYYSFINEITHARGLRVQIKRTLEATKKEKETLDICTCNHPVTQHAIKETSLQCTILSCTCTSYTLGKTITLSRPTATQSQKVKPSTTSNNSGSKNRPEWVKTHPMGENYGKAVWGMMKTYGWTKEQAEKKAAEYNS